MATITRLRTVADAGHTPTEAMTEGQAMEILEGVYPQLCNDVAMLVGKPFRLIWDPEQDTASTDCQAEVRITPWFFLEGRTDVGFGVTYHEGGHIIFSPYGGTLMAQAHREGGETLAQLVNIIVDRKDDMMNAEYAPGFAGRLRGRLAFICTMARREELKDLLKGMSDKDAMAVLRKLPPKDVHEDFFWAAKWHRSPRFRATHKAMRYLRRERLLKASPDELLYIAKKIREILGEAQPTPADRQRAERRMMLLVQLVITIERNRWRKLDKATQNALAKLATLYIGGVRASGMKRLEQVLRSLGTTFPGPVSVGMVDVVPVRVVPASPKFQPEYQALLESVEENVRLLMAQLRRLDTPSEFTIYGQEEGDLDLSASALIATGLSGFHQETVTERDIDAEIHLGIDCSGSMKEKIEHVKRIVTVFTESILQLAPALDGRVWSFNSQEICDFGPVSRQSGFVQVTATEGNSDTHFLRIIGKELGKSRHRRKILIMLCDDGPDNLEKASQISRELMARGIIVIHLLVGVHGTPEVYPIELLYTSMQECLEQFGELIMTVVKNLR